MKTLVVCESPWRSWSDPSKLENWSMRPFIEGLCDFYGVRLVYRTFTTRHELSTLLEGEAFDRAGGRTLLYISTHGSKGRLHPSSETKKNEKSPKGINLTTVSKAVTGGPAIKRGLEGVWLSACSAANGNLKSFLRNSGVVFAGGYYCNVDWMAAAKLDLAVMEAWMDSRRPKTRLHAVGILSKALGCFSPDWVVGHFELLDETRLPANLRESIRLVARNLTQGKTALDVTRTLEEKLGWLDPDERTTTEAA